MRIFTTVPQHDLRRVPEAARAAEADGYDGIISMENQHDPFLALAVAGAATERVELHTGVAISFARTPMATAQVGWDLADFECLFEPVSDGHGVLLGEVVAVTSGGVRNRLTS